MSEIRKQIKLERLEYYETHLAIVNCFLPIKLTPMELKVLSSFIALDGDIAKDRFGTTAKKFVRKNLEISSAGMSNYLRSLKDKGFLIGDDLKILPILFPESNEQIYTFRLINVG